MTPKEILVTRVWREVPVPPPEDIAEDPWGRPVRKSGVFTVKSLVSLTVIVVFIVTFVAQACRVPSESMQNTLMSGDFLLADKLHFADDDGAWDNILPYRAIQRGDIVVFRYPLDPSTYFVKRVIGVPGDHIHLKDKIVYVNGVPLRESYALHAISDNDPYRDNFPGGRENPNAACPVCNDLPRFINRGDVVVPAGRYFVMGDNRDHSSDSRYWGFVPRRNIVGRPLVIYLSVCGGADSGRSNCGDKLYSSGQILAPLLRLARWDRMFRLIR